MSRPPPAGAGGPAAAAVLWAAALRLAADVTRHSRALPRDGALRASNDFAAEWDVLVGRWVGEESSAAAGSRDVVATFDYELGGGVLTHRVQGGPASGAQAGDPPPDSLTTFFPRAEGRVAEAVRHDNAGQALRLEATWSADRRGLAMTSLPEAGEARWRWTWRFEDADTLHTRLERAAPGRDDFGPQASGTLRRTR